MKRCIFGIAVLSLSLLTATAHASKSDPEYLVTVTRPSTLHLVDMVNYKVVRQCEVPGGPAPGSVVMSPDKRIAYVLANHFGEVYGIDIDNCEVVFSTQQSSGNLRVRSMAAVALSPDGSELYTHQNRVRRMTDHYELLAPQLAVFDTSGGLNSEPVRSFDAPRQVTTMDTLASGEVLLGGPDVYRMNPRSGEYQVHLASRSLSNPDYAPRDVLTVWPLGAINNEFIRLYSTARFREPGNLETADWLWGYERVDLETGEAESKEFGPITAVLFTGARRPGHLDKVYGVLNHLKEFDVATQTELRSVDLPHTYYCVNFSRDGSRIYLAGALNKVAVYDAETLEPITEIELTGDGSMSNTVVFSRGS